MQSKGEAVETWAEDGKDGEKSQGWHQGHPQL